MEDKVNEDRRGHVSNDPICLKEEDWGVVQTTLKMLGDSYIEHKKSAWIRVGVAGIIGGLIGTGAGEAMMRLISAVFK